jgi:sec-independent protein translocase protein TatA
MFSNLTGWHALIILAVIVLIFGATKLPALAKAVGQSTKILKAELGTKDAEAAPVPTPAAGLAPRPAEHTTEL